MDSLCRSKRYDVSDGADLHEQLASPYRDGIGKHRPVPDGSGSITWWLAEHQRNYHLDEFNNTR